jgi:EthD domain-containing protein
MIKLFAFARRLPEMTPAEFHDHWANRHARYLADTPEIRRHIRRYELNHRLAADYERTRHAMEVDNAADDGVSVLWFDGLDEYRAFVEEPVLQAFSADDVPRFKVAQAPTVVTHDPDVIVERPRGRETAGLKLICILRRHPGLDLSTYHTHWREHHGGLFRDVAELRDPLYAYDQNHGLDLPDAEYDGVTEQWFGSLDEWVASLGVPAVPDLVNPDTEYFLDMPSIRFILAGPPTVVIAD